MKKVRRWGFTAENKTNLLMLIPEKAMAPTPVLLPGESQGREPGGLPSMGSHRVGHD